MISGDGWGLSFPNICLTVEEKHRKSPNQENWPDRGSNPRPLGERQRCYPLTTAVVLWRRDRNRTDDGCSTIFHCQRHKRSVTAAAVLLFAFSWRMLGFCQWRTVGSKFGEATMWWGIVLHVYIKQILKLLFYTAKSLDTFSLKINPLIHRTMWVDSVVSLGSPFQLIHKAVLRTVLM